MIPWLDTEDDTSAFPDPGAALTDPDGLLAAGGSLRPARLLNAYRHGIFPWFNPGEPILWWSPSKRAVIYPERIHISRRLQRALRKTPFTIKHNTAFTEVIEACAAPRHSGDATWISPAMIAAYCDMHKLGYARSIECYLDDKLVGGIYGIHLGKIFFGESMFHTVTNASKAVLIEASRQSDIRLIDCQIPNAHLETMGMTLIPREEFRSLLNKWCDRHVFQD